MRIFQIRESLDAGRPSGLTYADSDGRLNSAQGFATFQKNARISAGLEGTSESEWTPPVLSLGDPGDGNVGTWDYFSCPGSFGAFSEKAANVLSPFWTGRFVPITASLLDQEWYCLRCVRRLDCLDKTRSDVQYFDGTNDVMSIERFVFKELPDAPLMFAIPELQFVLFATGPVPDIAQQTGITGIEFELVHS